MGRWVANCPLPARGVPSLSGSRTIVESFSFETLQPLAHAHPSFSVLLHFLQGFARIGWTLVSGVHVGFV